MGSKKEKNFLIIKKINNIDLYLYNKKTLVINIDINNLCNQNCYYCYNTNKSNKLLDLNLLFLFISWCVFYLNKNINIHILGGEPTLHPQLLEFCEKIYNTFNNNVQIILYSNLSCSIDLLLKLFNCNVFFIFTWHSILCDRLNTQFLTKIAFIKNNIKNLLYTINLMFEPLYFDQSIHALKYLNKLNISNIEIGFVDHNHIIDIKNKNEYNYTNILILFINFWNIQLLQNKVKLRTLIINDKYISNLTQLILDNKLNFYNYKCMAGKDELKIKINGDISPCDDLYYKKIILGNIYKLNDLNIKNFHYNICQLKVCTCPLYSLKEKI